MTGGPLAGHGILVTRPVHQATELSRAIEAAGGRAISFPLLEIQPRDPAAVSADETALPRPHLTIYVSPNAVLHGYRWQVAGSALAAVGPSTDARLREQGFKDVICADAGFDSESLLDSLPASLVSGKNVRIVRGQDGRQLLGSELHRRGARVDYLEVYSRRARQVSAREAHELEQRLVAGEISCITLMSVATLESLIQALPGKNHELLRHTRLVTPSSRVLKNITDRMPGLPAALAPGPQAADMILGLTACLKQDKTE